MNTSSTPFPYLHGFSKQEQERLDQQAKFFEHTFYRHVDFSRVEHLLEVGCGVGAQSEILLRRFPNLKLTSVDLNDAQLETARQRKKALGDVGERWDIHKMDASQLDFRSKTFDGGFVCLLLEHVPEPVNVLSEVRRVLRPGGRLVVTEVMNHTFFLEPYSPNLWKYWQAFNDYQYENTGDPFVGVKLGNLLSQAGLSDIRTRPLTWHYDNRHPEMRKDIIDFWRDLVLSAQDILINSGHIDVETVELMKQEFAKVSSNPNSVFYYSLIQAYARSF